MQEIFQHLIIKDNQKLFEQDYLRMFSVRCREQFGVRFRDNIKHSPRK